jgi:CelD/BcsL family acetyltransferase involved in cellulose biosynthesis
MRTAEIPMRSNPYIPVPASRDLLKRLPTNSRLRGKLRQVRRELGQRGTLRLRRVTSAQPDDLKRFYELEASGWKGEASSAIAAHTKTLQFYDEISRGAGQFGYLSMYFLELDGRPLAAHLGLCYREIYYSPKLAYDETFKDFAPGHLIISEILEDCVTRGVRVYDITGPDDEWKMRWTESVRRRFHFLIFQNGVLGRMAHMLHSRVRPWTKRMILMRGPRS